MHDDGGGRGRTPLLHPIRGDAPSDGTSCSRVLIYAEDRIRYVYAGGVYTRR